MTRTRLLLFTLLFASLACQAPSRQFAFEAAHTQDAADERGTDRKNDDRKAVEAACRDYVEGIYRVDPARIERSVDPRLVKLGFYRRSPQGEFQRAEMTYEQLHDLAATYNAEGQIPADAPQEITVLDVLNQTASAKLVAAWGVDYFHLGKVDGRWMILQVLWQEPPPVH